MAFLVNDFTFFIATLTIIHGRLEIINGIPSLRTREVIAIAALDLNRSSLNQYFDCESTNGLQNLVWEKQVGPLRFPSSIEFDVLRLDLSPQNSSAVGYADLDVYSCRDTETGDRKSINFTEGIYLIISGYKTNPWKFQSFA